jgi:RNA polymerase sigma-70 factor (ECF subfamily)
MGLDAAAFVTELDSHRRYLLRVARLQLRDPDLAEDVVQDTMLAALKAREGYTGASTVKTWITGILKHKIVDAIRARQRAPVALTELDEDTDIDEFDGLFKANGAWADKPAEWGDPESALSRQQFFEVLEMCLDNLPPKTARVFVMREVMELATEEVCKELAITPNNLWVILYRARMALRLCLEKTWFKGPAAA